MSVALSRALPTARVVVLSLLCVFSLAVLAANGNFAHLELTAESKSAHMDAKIDAFICLNLAVSVMTMVTLLVMLIADFIRRKAWTSLIAVEITWLGVLIILWLSTSAYTSSIFSSIKPACSAPQQVSEVTTVCTDIQVSMAFSWMSWILMSAYWATLVWFAVTSARKGNAIWISTVKTAGTEKAASTEFSSSRMWQQVQPGQTYSPSAAMQPV